MEKMQFGSVKHKLITEANKKVLIATGVAAFVVTFSLVSCYMLFNQMKYQNKVISARNKALAVATDSQNNIKQLRTSYTTFNSQSPNVLGGVNGGNGEKDGTNTKIVLDALPSVYNYPALFSSIEKIVNNNKLEFQSISGSDDAIAQQQNAKSAAPAPIEMPFEFTVKGSYASIQALVGDLERSIRPFQIVSVGVNAEKDNGVVTAKITGKTFFQPQKDLNLVTEKVK